uniref:Uncharacterized protein n=1 Tax=Avena sativa TaxID=4498 RepID=A0ACD5UZA8_AVESA
MTSTSSWFSGITRTVSGNPSSLAMPPAGGVASAPASVPDPPAAVGGKGGVVASVATAGAGARKKKLQGSLFKYGPKSAQVRAYRSLICKASRRRLHRRSMDRLEFFILFFDGGVDLASFFKKEGWI